MDAEYLDRVRRGLEAKGVMLGRGLSEEELAGVEADFGFRFPPDLRAMLAVFQPMGEEWPDWRGNRQRLLEWLDEPADGIEFDVEENGFWLAAWGERPEDDDDAVEEARRQVALAPVLIPLFGHRFLPSRPVEAGNPVFSVIQSEIAVLAPDLAGWLEAEWGIERPGWSRAEARPIELWSGFFSE